MPTAPPSRPPVESITTLQIPHHYNMFPPWSSDQPDWYIGCSILGAEVLLFRAERVIKITTVSSEPLAVISKTLVKPISDSRLLISGLCALLLALCVSAEAQQPAKIPRVGYISVSGNPNNPSVYVDAFRKGLRDLGYIEGKNIVVELRYAAEEPDRNFAAELVKANVDVLVSSSTGSIRAAKQATTTIPIVMIASFDPVEAAIVDSFARPGGNITGLTRLSLELNGKRLELFKEAVPGISRVGVLAAQGFTAFKEYEAAARPLKISVRYLEIRGPNPDLDEVLRGAAKEKMNAVIVMGSRFINRYRKELVELPIKNRLASMYAVSGYVEAGGLMSYSTKILKRSDTQLPTWTKF